MLFSRRSSGSRRHLRPGRGGGGGPGSGGAAARCGPHVEVSGFDGLTVDFARRSGAGFIVRGLRAVSDFEAELQMAHTNRKLQPAVDTVFLMSALEYGYVSSSLAKEVAQ